MKGGETDVSVNLHLRGAGWADFSLSVGGRVDQVFDVSYLCDPFGDLVRAASSIACGAHRAEVRFALEPGDERYVFDWWLEQKEWRRCFRIQRFSSPSLWGERATEDLQLAFEADDVDADAFCASVLLLSDSILSAHGLEGYAEMWDPRNVAFPVRGVAALRAALGANDPKLLDDEDD